MRWNATSRPPASTNAALTRRLSCFACSIAPATMRLASSRVKLISLLPMGVAAAILDGCGRAVHRDRGNLPARNNEDDCRVRPFAMTRPARRMTGAADAAVMRVECITVDGELARFAPEWTELWRRAPAATPF